MNKEEKEVLNALRVALQKGQKLLENLETYITIKKTAFQESMQAVETNSQPKFVDRLKIAFLCIDLKDPTVRSMGLVIVILIRNAKDLAQKFKENYLVHAELDKLDALLKKVNFIRMKKIQLDIEGVYEQYCG